MTKPIVYSYEHVGPTSAYVIARTESGNYMTLKTVEGARLRKVKSRTAKAPWRVFNELKKNPGWGRVEGPKAREKDIRDMISRIKAKLDKREGRK